jgi:hypothetical protein
MKSSDLRNIDRVDTNQRIMLWLGDLYILMSFKILLKNNDNESSEMST